MRLPLYIPLFLAALVLQLTVIPLFSINGVTPDIILILVIAVSLQKGRTWGVISGFLAGILFDIFGTGFVGVSSFANSVSAYVAGFFGGEQLEREFLVVTLLLFFSLLVHDMLYFLILSIGTPVGFFQVLLRQIIPQTIYTFTFMIILHLLSPRLLWGTKTTQY